MKIKKNYCYNVLFMRTKPVERGVADQAVGSQQNHNRNCFTSKRVVRVHCGVKNIQNIPLWTFTTMFYRALNNIALTSFL